MSGGLLGWCQDAMQAAGEWGSDPRFVASLHDQCPAVIEARPWPDPSRKGATYELPEHRCSCICHTRPVV